MRGSAARTAHGVISSRTFGYELLSTGALLRLAPMIVSATTHSPEPPLLTLGQDVGFLPGLVASAGADFDAADVVAYLLGQAHH